MAAFRLVSAGFVLLLASCATIRSDVSAQDAGAGAVAIDCASYHRSDAPLVFHAMDANIPPSLPASRIVTGAGVSIPISVGHFDPRRGIEPVPLQCMDFEVSPSDAARISQDGLSIEIGDDARPGPDIQLTGNLRASRESSGSVTLRIVVIDDITRQLIGTWSFDAVRGCDGAQVDPPLEIRFEADNGLSVTWTPFGRYWDYWGRYEWSPDSGAFSVTPTGGNQIPSDISVNGEMVLEGDQHLALSGAHFGSRTQGAPRSSVSAAEAGCTLVFRRQGAGPQ